MFLLSRLGKIEFLFLDLPEKQLGKKKVNCTTVDAEMDKLKAALPEDKKDKLKLAFLLLDVEGHELVAIQGIHNYSPMKAQIETKYMDTVSKCPQRFDTC